MALESRGAGCDFQAIRMEDALVILTKKLANVLYCPAIAQAWVLCERRMGVETSLSMLG